MKIILEDNSRQVEIKDSNCKNNMQDILENLIIPALQGLGFSGAEEFFDNKEELPTINRHINTGERMVAIKITKE